MISSVTAFQPCGTNDPDDWRTQLGQIAVRIKTSDGLTGYGVGGGGKAGIHVIDTVLARLLLNRSAADIETLWRDMYEATLAFGRKGIAIMAISGVDLALWDLAGKRKGKPLWTVLDGRPPKPIPAYLTGWTLDRILCSDTTEAPGCRAFKLDARIHEPADISRLADRLQRLRQHLGPDAMLMADACMTLDRDTAARLADALGPAGLAWLEEPLPPDDLEGYAFLRDRSPVPIAGGEHEFTAKAFEPLIADKLHAVVQPDVCWCGGLSELIKIYRLAQEHGVRCCPHRGAEAWSLPAIAALDNNPLAESGRPWINWVEGQPAIVNGHIAPPDSPGFGVKLPFHD